MFDNMRGVHARCPPFFIAGLLVFSFVISFNWWSLSTQNTELVRQVEELSEQLKISSEGQDMCVHQRLSAEARIKNLEDDMAQLQVRLEQQRSDNEETKKRLLEKDSERQDIVKERDTAQQTADACITELESLKKLDVSKDGIITSLRLEKDAFVTQLEERNKEILKLKSEVETAQLELDKLKPNNGQKSSATPVLKSSAAPSAIVPVPAPKADIGVAVGGDHESLNQDANNVENENNAAEEDDQNVDEAGGVDDPDPMEPVRMEVPNENIVDNISNHVNAI